MSKLSDERARRMEAEDRLEDLLEGLRFWKREKVAALDWSTLDEMFIRWVEHNERTS